MARNQEEETGSLGFETSCGSPQTCSETTWAERIAANGRTSSMLTDLRDTLLPKLISGELRVPEAEELVGAAS